MEEKPATEANVPPIAVEETGKVLPETQDDLEAKNKALEDEKSRLIVESANYKMAYLKEKSRKKDEFGDDDEDSDDKIRRITQETLANSRLAEIAREQDEIIKKALRENKELKLAQLNKTGIPPATMGTHSEAPKVMDTLVTPEQMSAFKAKGWSDKDIERYKRNLQKNTR